MVTGAPESESTPIFSRKDFANHAIRVVSGLFRRHGRTRRPFVSPVPVKVHDRYISMLVSPLLSRKNEEIGEIRTWVEVPESDILPVRVRVEWTRNAFGFWYRNEFTIPNIEDPTSDLVYGLNSAIKPVKITADGSVRVSSMNLSGIRKVKKNKVRDSAARYGLMMG